MSVYLDASALVSIHVVDAHAMQMRSWMTAVSEPVLVSLWAVAEFSSALALRRRIGVMDAAECAAAESALDRWLEAGVVTLIPDPVDFALARHLIRSGRIAVKAADGLHLASAIRTGAMLVSFDLQMRRAAQAMGVTVQPYVP